MQLKVFISSRLQELKEERKVVEEAVSELWNNENLPFTIWRWESAKEIPSGKHPDKVQSKGVRDSGIYVLILGSEYGDFKYRESPTHKEYDTARSNLEEDCILIYIKEVEEREEKLEKWIDEIKNKHASKPFKNSYHLKDLVKTRLRDVWFLKRGHAITYFPEDPPDVADFVNRDTEQNNLEELIRRKKHMIIIQGIAGIGKTQIAAKLMENIKNDYITYWKEMRNVDTFDRVIKDSTGLAGFLRENNDSELADYIGNDGTDHETIINILLSCLKEKQYALFFDNYQVVENKEVHDLFKRFKDKLTNSTIIITTREPPQFVNPVIDEIENKVKEENVKGFELEATREYLEQKGVEVFQEQLVKIDRKIGGHPNSLRLFASLSGEMEIDEIIENLPETEVLDWLYYVCYDKLIRDEQEVLEALSVFRTAVTADACIQVSKTSNIKKILMSLIRKLLVERKRNLYYLHDSIRELSYGLIDNPKDYHKRASEYYSQLEKTPENILETTYHLVKNVGVVNDEVIDYLMEAPRDNYTRFVILGILDSNEITTTKLFELLEEFLSDENVEIQSLAVSILAKNRHLDIDYTLGILEEVIERDTSPHLIKRTIQSLSKFGEERRDDIFRIMEQIVQSQRYEYYWSILVLIKDIGIEDPEIIEILKKIATTQLFDLRWYNNRKEAFELLKKRGITLFEEASQIDYLRELRQMTAEQALDYVEKLAHPDEERRTDIHLFGFDHNFLFFILRELYKVRPYETSDLMSHFLTILERNPFQHIFEILGEHKYFNSEIIRGFVESDNRIISLTGFMALEYALNKVVDGEVVNVDEEIRNEILRLLRKIMTWEEKNPLLAAMATVTYEEATNPYEQERIGLSTRIGTGFVKGVVELLGPRTVKNFMTATDSEIKEYNVVLYWSSYKGILHTKPNKLREVFRVMGKDDDMFLRVCDFMYEQLRISPEGALDILYKFALKSEESQVRNGAVDLGNIVGRLAPEKVLEIYEKLLPLPEYQDNRTRLTLTHNFRNFLETSQGKRARKDLEELMKDNDRQVGMLADIILNGIQFRE